MAVNYPAREFGIKRGDSFDVIQQKSKGKCVAIHLPVTPVDEASVASISPHGEQSPQDNTQREDDDDNDDEVDSSPSAYDEEFNQPNEIREEMYRMEKNKMRDPSEGKACLDRYEH